MNRELLCAKKNSCLGALMLALVCAVVGCNESPRESKHGSVVCTAEPRYHFGFSYEGQKLERSFELINRSDRFIRIANTQQSCSCTAILSDYEGISPGNSLVLKAIVDTTGKQAGPWHVTTTVLFADDTPPLTFTLEGNTVIPAPKRLDFGDIARDSDGVREFCICGLPQENIMIEELTYNHDRFEVGAVMEASIPSCIKLRVRCKPNSPRGRFCESRVNR